MCRKAFAGQNIFRGVLVKGMSRNASNQYLSASSGLKQLPAYETNFTRLLLCGK